MICLSTFEDDPNALLIRASDRGGGTRISTLPVPMPFTQDALDKLLVASSNLEIGIERRHYQTAKGDRRLKRDHHETAQRAGQDRQREASMALLQASSMIAATREYAAALERKREVDEEIRRIRDRNMIGHRWRLAELGTESQALQIKLGQLRRAERREGAESFMRAAYRVLSEGDLARIREKMDALAAEEEQQEDGAAATSTTP